MSQEAKMLEFDFLIPPNAFVYSPSAQFGGTKKEYKLH